MSNSAWIFTSDQLLISGRALEELRGVLYSELRTSEGAKRQQQRLCGPAVAMTFNFLVAVGIIMANKLVCNPSFPLLSMLEFLIYFFSQCIRLEALLLCFTCLLDANNYS